MARRKLLDEVSVQELMNMREIEGLSNSKIAERLDVSAAAIYNHIGPAGKTYRRERRVAPKPAEEPQCAGLLPCGKDEFFVASGRKRICIHNGKTVDILQMTEDGDKPILAGLKREDVETLAGELKAVLQLIGA